MKLNLNVLFAIFWRNFISYFSNPTGYVFICLFVLVTAFAAFWPDDFFSANLANLDQLNKYLPWIMLLFIPAVTMSIWAEERQEGTDELLLTIPARDLDVVLGKYLAAVAIYTGALLFSVVNVIMLYNLGRPDGGLLFANYVGYWFVGVAMLSVGMVASFMTSNLTVAFILGVVFNAPLVFSASSDVLGNILTMLAGKILPASWMPGITGRFESMGRFLSSFSIAEQFQDFGRGMITLSGLTYFISITVVMLYLSMVLIGRRHWSSGRDNRAMGGHYLLRSVALMLAAVGLNLITARMETTSVGRLDVSHEQLSSLSPQTISLLANLKTTRPISIQAYISPEVPERYVQTRLNLISMLREIDRRGGDSVVVKINNTEAFSPKAEEAEQQFGIIPRELESSVKGNGKSNAVFLGFAVSSGLSKIVTPFVDHGIPVEYELVRSIVTVSEEKKPRLGLVGTDARMMPGFDMQSFRQLPGARVIDELQKQYEVVQIDASNPIELTEEIEEKDSKGNKVKVTKERFKALMVVQPSKMAPPQLDNLLRAMRAGAPTAIFEDPLPFFGLAPPTSQRRQAQQQNPMFSMGQPPPEQCDIQKLWDLLGVDFSGPDVPDLSAASGGRRLMPDKSGTKVLWQEYNPHPRLKSFPPLWVFIGPPNDEWPAFDSTTPVTSSLQELLFPFPGEIRKRGKSSFVYTPLVKTMKGKHGTIGLSVLEQQYAQVARGQVMAGLKRVIEPSVLAYLIEGKVVTENLPMADEKADEKTAASAGKKGKELKVVLVSDVDFFDGQFFALREIGVDPDNPFTSMNLDNVTFMLNVLDLLAGEERFLDVRNRRRKHRTLQKVEDQVRNLQDRIDDVYKKTEGEIRTQEDEGNKKIEDKVKEIVEELQKVNPDREAIGQEIKRVQKEEQEKLNRVVARATRNANAVKKQTEREVGRDIQQLQDGYKLAAVVVPPILPLILAISVFFIRRSREREGISRKRLR